MSIDKERELIRAAEEGKALQLLAVAFDAAVEAVGASALVAVDRASLEVVPDVDAIAQFIRKVDGNHDMGAAALAERLYEWLSAAQREQK